MHTIRRGPFLIDLTANWSAKNEDECLTLTASDEGAFQLSEFVKRTGSVTNDEIRGFYEKENPGVGLSEVFAGEFSGYSIDFKVEDSVWSKYWLGAGRVLLLATYYGSVSAYAREMPEVRLMLNTLRLAAEHA